MTRCAFAYQAIAGVAFSSSWPGCWPVADADTASTAPWSRRSDTRCAGPAPCSRPAQVSPDNYNHSRPARPALRAGQPPPPPPPVVAPAAPAPAPARTYLVFFDWDAPT